MIRDENATSITFLRAENQTENILPSTWKNCGASANR